MIIGAHSILYSKDPEADRAFLRDALRLPNVDVGDGWLVFALPPAEVAIHPARQNDVHESYLMVKGVEALVAAMAKRGVTCTPPRDLGWGVLTRVQLPGGGRLGVYEPRHARPRWSKPSRRPVRRGTPARPKTSGRATGAGRTRGRG